MSTFRPHRLMLAIAVAFCVAPAASAQDVGLQVKENGEWAPFLVDQDERSLYVFSLNSAGASIGACEEECLERWPPLIIEGSEPEIGSGVDQERVSTVERPDGRLQVTYYGWPLFYYFEDEGSDTKGQNLRDHGGPWYLIGPDGMVRNPSVEPTTPPKDADGPL